MANLVSRTPIDSRTKTLFVLFGTSSGHVFLPRSPERYDLDVLAIQRAVSGTLNADRAVGTIYRPYPNILLVIDRETPSCRTQVKHKILLQFILDIGEGAVGGESFEKIEVYAPKFSNEYFCKIEKRLLDANIFLFPI